MADPKDLTLACSAPLIDLENPLETVSILGVSVQVVDKSGILEKMVAWSRQPVRRTITYVNAHCLNIAQEDPQSTAILNAADLVYADGYSVVLASHFLHGKRLEKITGRDWIADFCQVACQQGLRIYILAGKPGIAARAKSNLELRYPGLQVVGCTDGYFFERSEGAVLKEIGNMNPDVVLVGMGSPLQEKWIAAHRDEIETPVCWAVGALFDYVAGAEPPVPTWLNTLGMEWFWRLLMDPAGKWRRYLLGNPIFIARILHQKLFPDQ